MILQRVSPVTHSIGNCVKRVVVIVASVFVFQNPVTAQNAAGEPPLWPGWVEGCRRSAVGRVAASFGR